jgi:hypothetical protein
MKRCMGFIVFLGLITAAWPQNAPAPAKTADLQAIISAQFGPQFALMPEFPVLTGDFNGDGVEDVLFVASLHGGLQAESKQFKVLDPSSSYFGLGDPKITSQFASKYPGGKRYLLILHGSGKEAWHAKELTERFVLINFAFDRLSVGHIMRKKKIIDDIGVEETGILNSFIYWSGRKYEWQPGASEL